MYNYTSKTCRHMMPSGRTCKSPAMRGSAYCYYHGPQKSPRRVTKPAECELELETIVDASCIAAASQKILTALAENQISKGRAAVLLQALQTILATYRVPLMDFDIPIDPADPTVAPETYSEN